MHIIAILTSIAVLIYWVSRAAGGMGNIFGAGRAVANMPRKHRYMKESGKRGYDLIQSPVEAATVLMISTAKLSDERHLTPVAEGRIIDQLMIHMQMDQEDASDLLTQTKAIVHNVVLPESAVFPMVDIIRKDVGKDDAEQLAQMMESVAQLGTPNQEQREFIRRYRERLNLL